MLIKLRFLRRFLARFLLIIFLILIKNAFSVEIPTAEGIIKYIGKPTQYNPPYVLLSSSQRLYTTIEIYEKILNMKDKYLYFKLENNKVVEFSDTLPENYTYIFPEIMKINKFEFDNYDTYYILWYFNFSPFVEITTNEKNVFIYYTSPNSLTIRVPKNYNKKKITLIANYSNQKIKQQKKYIININ
ncbi:MAG: hypothetical protein ACK4GJ_04990 [bacterium]